MNNSFADLLTFILLKVIQYAFLLIGIGVFVASIVETLWP